MVIISLGSNVTSRWGDSAYHDSAGFSRARKRGVGVLRRSRLYRTLPYGPVDQPVFYKCGSRYQDFTASGALLSIVKKIEARAGRGSSAHWGPRALDLDIIDYNRQILNWSQRDTQFFKCKRFSLILPHPRIETRAFVLQPLLDLRPIGIIPSVGRMRRNS